MLFCFFFFFLLPFELGKHSSTDYIHFWCRTQERLNPFLENMGLRLKKEICGPELLERKLLKFCRLHLKHFTRQYGNILFGIQNENKTCLLMSCQRSNQQS